MAVFSSKVANLIQGIGSATAHVSESLRFAVQPQLEATRGMVREASAELDRMTAPYVDPVYNRVSDFVGPRVQAGAARVAPALRAAGKVISDNKGKLLAGTGVVLTAATGAVASSLPGVAMDDFPDTPNAVCVDANVHASPTMGTLPDGSTWKSAFTGHLDEQHLCIIDETALAQGQEAKAWLESPAAKTADGDQVSRMQAQERDARVSLAEADLELLKLGAADPTLKPSAVLRSVKVELAKVATDEQAGDPDVLVQDYLALEVNQGLEQARAAASKGVDVDQDRWIVRKGGTGSNPKLEQGGFFDPVLGATEHVGSEVKAQHAAFASAASSEQRAEGALLRSLTTRAEPTWAADHPHQTPSADLQAQLRQALEANTSFADASKTLDLAYRASPGVLEAHAAAITADVQAQYDSIVPGHRAAADVVASAKKMWLQGSSKDETRSMVVTAIRGSDAYRQKLADAALSVARRMGTEGKCATGVADAIQAVYGVHVSGNANAFVQSLPASGFHRVDLSLQEALRHPGYVLVWQSGNTEALREYGHVEVTLGDGGTSMSDHVESNTVAMAALRGRTGLTIWAPN